LFQSLRSSTSHQEEKHQTLAPERNPKVPFEAHPWKPNPQCGTLLGVSNPKASINENH